MKTASPIASLKVGDRFLVADFVLRHSSTTPELVGEPKFAVVTKVGRRWLYAERTWIDPDTLPAAISQEIGPFDRATREADHWSRTTDLRMAFTDMADLDTWVFAVEAARTSFDRIRYLTRADFERLPPEAIGELVDWLDHWVPAK